MKVSDIDWEIKQLSVAIDYYERAINDAFARVDTERYKDTIDSLNQRIKKLEAKRDERGK